MTNNQPLFTPNPDCPEGGYLISMPGLLLMMGTYAYAPDDEITPQGRAKATDALGRILKAARAGGHRFLPLWAVAPANQTRPHAARAVARHRACMHKLAPHPFTRWTPTPGTPRLLRFNTARNPRRETEDV